LTMKDLEIARALEEKQRIIADIFQIPPEEYDSITDIVAQHEQKADAKDVLLTAITQADNLDRYISSALKVEDSYEDNGEREVTPPAAISSLGRTRLASPPTDRLLQITESLKSSLRALLGIMQEEEEEENEEEEDESRYDDLSAAAEFSAWGIRPAESAAGPRSGDSAGGRTGDTGSPWGPRNLDSINRPRDLEVRSRSRPSSYLSLGSDNADLLSEDGNRSSEGGGSLAHDLGEMPRLQLIPSDNDNDKGRPLSSSGELDASNNTIKDKTPTNDDIDNADVLNHNLDVVVLNQNLEVDNDMSSVVEEIGQINETTTSNC